MTKTTNILLAVIAGALLWPQVAPPITSAVTHHTDQQAKQERREKRYREAVLAAHRSWFTECDGIFTPLGAVPEGWAVDQKSSKEMCLANRGTRDAWVAERTDHLKS